jgi:adenine-specific DNA-methyltransferase
LSALRGARSSAGPADSPADLAWRLSLRFAEEQTPEQRKAFGQFFTPVEVARFMAQLATSPAPRCILDPGAGTGLLSCALCEFIPAGSEPIHITAFETDPRLADLCEEALLHASDWLRSDRGVDMTFTVARGDFVLENAARLRPILFSEEPRGEEVWYDAAILNPPYFKLQKTDPRAIAAAPVVHGQPNIYSLFMGITASLLAPGGVMVSITPRSFSGGDYFRRFRQHLFGLLVPDVVHLFASRKDAFREDAVLQENVIVGARRVEASPDATVEVSESRGIADLGDREVRHVPLKSVIDLASASVSLNIPTTPLDDEIVALLRGWDNSLMSWRLQVSTGPVVAFRARQFLRGEPDETTVPMLWLNNVRPLAVQWPLSNGKPQYICSIAESRKLLVPSGNNYVLLRRFTAKEERRRLLAAPLRGGMLPGELLGFENHLNYVYRPHDGLTDDETAGIAALFNSALLDRYIRISNGNTQVNASELRSLPLPDPVQVSKIGRRVRASTFASDTLDEVISTELELPHDIAHALERGVDG